MWCLQGSSGNLQGLGGLNAMRNAGGQYAPAELSGWGGNLGGGNPNPSQLDTLLAAQVPPPSLLSPFGPHTTALASDEKRRCL